MSFQEWIGREREEWEQQRLGQEKLIRRRVREAESNMYDDLSVCRSGGRARLVVGRPLKGGMFDALGPIAARCVTKARGCFWGSNRQTK